MWIENIISQCHTHELKEHSLSTCFYVTRWCLWSVWCWFHWFNMFSGLFCFMLPMLTIAHVDKAHRSYSFTIQCMYGMFSGSQHVQWCVQCIISCVSNHTFQQSHSLFKVCGSMHLFFSISIACQVKASQEDRNNFFNSTTSQQSPMTLMQHWNKGPPTGTHLHIPLTPKVL